MNLEKLNLVRPTSYVVKMWCERCERVVALKVDTVIFGGCVPGECPKCRSKEVKWINSEVPVAAIGCLIPVDEIPV